MASTFNGVNALSGGTAANGQQPKQYQIGANDVVFYYDIATALVVNDVINMMVLPANAYITGVTLDTDDLDTGGTATVILGVGTTGSPTLFIAGSTKAQTGGIEYINQSGTIGKSFAINQQIVVKCTNAPQTGTSTGRIRLGLRYTVDP